ncbi:hypothetical protein Pla52n_18050 [Stieleria varia]|uniref:Uncharacterized protein n=1 Tax=Stieleria varia TaxID=2528005 RepID=A0A5C6B195_9BACT|nr:hypothetical protein Pla52n_18050 [Stieleria varia]
MTSITHTQSCSIAPIGLHSQTDQARQLSVQSHNNDFGVNWNVKLAYRDYFVSPRLIVSSSIEAIKRMKTLWLPKSHWAVSATR